MVNGFIPINFAAIANDIDQKKRAIDIMINTTLNESELFLIDKLRTYVHVWQPGKPRKKPHMRDTIRRERSGRNYRIVTVPTDYARIENARLGQKPGHGSHNFGDKAYNETLRRYDPIIKRRINEILQRYSTGVIS